MKGKSQQAEIPQELIDLSDAQLAQLLRDANRLKKQRSNKQGR